PEEDIGYVGEVESVNTELLQVLVDNGYIPVIAPVGVGEGGKAYNINADLVASEVAQAIGAEKLIFLTDTEGVKDANGRLISSLDKERALHLISSGVIKGGMVPKVRSALRALEAGVGKVHVIDGRVPHSILLEVFTEEGIGTEIVR
ncbi:MAG: acetylglutamate kinase, partial [Aquificaceae bacterium]|nr:acetylglutamate kinase [Aquificaceae bacterium]